MGVADVGGRNIHSWRGSGVVETTVAHDRPVLGCCLGAHVAHAAGPKVYPNVR